MNVVKRSTKERVQQSEGKAFFYSSKEKEKDKEESQPKLMGD